MRLTFDIETTAMDFKDPDFWPECVHCIVTHDVDTGEVNDFRPHQIKEALWVLSHADVLIGHNIAKFDIPVLEKLYGFEYRGNMIDTLAVSRQVYVATLERRSFALRNSAGRKESAREARMPKRLVRSHSLEAWGYRLGCRKGGSPNDWSVFTEEMLDYCRQDVAVNVELYFHLLGAGPLKDAPASSEASMFTESRYAYLLGKQERNGVGFNEPAAQELYGLLAGRRADLIQRLSDAVPPWSAPDGQVVVPKRSAVSKKCGPGEEGYRNVEEGCAYTKIKRVDFNPASGHHRERVLRGMGWVPESDAYTPCGLAQTDEKVLAGLDYPIIPDLIEYLTVEKRISQLAEGKQAWLGAARREKIHGGVNGTGTRTGRCTHVHPNLAQVPRVGSPYGEECRALFRPTRHEQGWVVVGADASGLELRMLASRMAFFDDGAFGKVLLEGDPHTDWMRSTGIMIRDNQKTFTYAMLYGAGDRKLGAVVIEDWRMAHERGLVEKAAPDPRYARGLGRVARGRLLSGLSALESLLARCREAHQRGWLRGLDGRVIIVKTEHGALNDLLQGDGAVVMKTAKVLLADRLVAAGWQYGVDYSWMLDVHDEWQLEAPPERADNLGKLMVGSIRDAGTRLKLRVPLDAEYKIGNDWSETH